MLNNLQKSVIVVSSGRVNLGLLEDLELVNCDAHRDTPRFDHNEQIFLIIAENHFDRPSYHRRFVTVHYIGDQTFQCQKA